MSNGHLQSMRRMGILQSFPRMCDTLIAHRACGENELRFLWFLWLIWVVGRGQGYFLYSRDVSRSIK